MTYPTSALIIEQSQTFSLYLQLLLQRMGLKALRVSEPEITQNVLERGFTDIVIVGDQESSRPLHTVVEMLASYIGTRPIPIIAVSQQDDPAERRACYEAGCRTFLLKPVQPKELQDALYAEVSPESERRKNLRSTVNLSVNVSIDQEGPETLRLLSLSEGGALVRRKTAVPVGTGIVMHLPLDDSLVELAGKVIYNLANYDGNGLRAFGVAFQDVPAGAADLIHHVLEKSLRHDQLVPRSGSSKVRYIDRRKGPAPA